MNKMREQFESIAKKHYWLRDVDSLWDEDFDCYRAGRWQLAWEMWKASRDSLVIELPQPLPPVMIEHPNNAHNNTLREIKKILSKQGVKYE